jgi:hypothetical protein
MITAETIRTPTAEAWRTDLSYLADELERKHKNLYANISRARFAAAVQALHARIPALARHEVIVELARLAALIGDGHTNLYLDANPRVLGFHRYPLRLGLRNDILFIRSTDPARQDLLGARVIGIGTVPAGEAVARVRDLIGAENEMRRLSWAPFFLTVPEILHAHGIITTCDAAAFEIEQAGRRRTVVLTPLAGGEASWVNVHEIGPAPCPLYLQDPGNAFWFTYLAGSQTVYLQYNAVRDKAEETLAGFFGRVFAFVADHPVERFVIDLRANGGGNNMLNWPLIYGLIRADSVNQPGKLFTIIGRGTFSAAMNCVTALERHTHTLFVGEPTGASPNHYGDATPIVLPHSGLSVYASTLYWQESWPWDARPWTAPNLPAPLTYADILANRDPAMDAIRHYDRHAPDATQPGVVETHS